MLFNIEYIFIVHHYGDKQIKRVSLFIEKYMNMQV
jgi:hypothetical protein